MMGKVFVCKIRNAKITCVLQSSISLDYETTKLCSYNLNNALQVLAPYEISVAVRFSEILSSSLDNELDCSMNSTIQNCPTYNCNHRTKQLLTVNEKGLDAVK
jgi:hypothetical protein